MSRAFGPYHNRTGLTLSFRAPIVICKSATNLSVQDSRCLGNQEKTWYEICDMMMMLGVAARAGALPAVPWRTYSCVEPCRVLS